MIRRTLLWLLALIVTVGLTCYLLTRPDPLVSMTGDLVPRLKSGAPAGDFRNAQRTVELYREKIRRHPEIAETYVRLAHLYLQEARVSGNYQSYIPRAEALLDEALTRHPGDFSATIAKASMLMTLHRFDEARMLARQAITANRHNAFAYGVLTDALVETGDYDQAVRVCDTMVSIRPDLRSYSRVSYLRELYGDRGGAIRAMRMAADAGQSGDEGRVWSLCMLANLYLQEGKQDTAAFLFRGILEERPDYPFALSGLAQVTLTKGDTGQAVTLLNRAQEIMPEHIFLEQLAEIYRLRGDGENESRCLDLALRDFARDEELGWNTDREFALVCADFGFRLSDAIARAGQEYGRRPENTDAQDTYAWALYKNGRAAEAYPLVKEALRLSRLNSTYLFHAGMIASALGRHAESRSFLEQARSGWMKPLYRAELQQALRNPELAANTGGSVH